jgi:simple sugar transport system permease protein
MKAFARTDEIVVTLMLNYVAIFWVDYLVYAPGKIRKDMVSPERRLSPARQDFLFF